MTYNVFDAMLNLTQSIYFGRAQFNTKKTELCYIFG